LDPFKPEARETDLDLPNSEANVTHSTVAQGRRLDSIPPSAVYIARFNACNSAKRASIRRIVPKMCSRVTKRNTLTEKRFIA
jgi:hypothetical protein